MNNLGVNAVKNSLADLADLCFGWIDEAACRVVIEIWFVIFEGCGLVFLTREAFITLKDHKPNFDNNPTCRLINPTKAEIGKISKRILDRINTKVVHTLQLNQWKNTKAVLNWFNSIQCKAPCSFITFDVVDFYPSISIDLLNAALDFASQHVYISNDDRHIILQAKTSLLCSNGELWAKKTSSNLFDITMGSYDGVESCELVGAYLLYLIREEFRDTCDFCSVQR